MPRNLFLRVIMIVIGLIVTRDCDCSAQISELTFADANSLRDQAFAYVEQIVQGDVLVREVEVFEALDGDTENKSPSIIIESTVYYRAVFDFERERFALYRVVDREVDMISEPSKNRSVGRYLYGVCFDSERNDKVHQNAIPGGHSVRSRSSFPEPIMTFLRQLEFRDCRTAFMSLECLPAMDFYQLALQRQLTGDTTTEVQRVGKDQIEIITPSPSASVPDGWRAIYQRQRERFDIKSGFRLSTELDGRFIGPDGIESKSKSPKITWKVDWIGEVPIVIAGHYTGREQKGHNGRLFKGETRRSFDFHWIHLNEQPEEMLFDPSNLESADRILALLDPEKVSAKKLIRRPAPQLGASEND